MPTIEPMCGFSVSMVSAHAGGPCHAYERVWLDDLLLRSGSLGHLGVYFVFIFGQSSVCENDVMIRKSLICFRSRAPGGRVDVVVRMIGHIFLKMWGFCGESPPPPPSPRFFLLLLLLPCCLLVLPFVGFLERRHFDTRRHWQEDTVQEDKKKVNI